MTRSEDAAFLLAIDTATSRTVLAIGTPDGTLIAADTWPAGHRHVEELLPRLEALLAGRGEGRAALARASGIIVGTGPGAFTGLRVGLATAKALAVAFGVPLVGIGTSTALLAAAADADPAIDPRTLVLLLPAGAAGCYIASPGGTRLALGAVLPLVGDGATAIAVDLAGRATADALARGLAATDRLPAMLLHLGAARLETGPGDDPAHVLPDYVSLPRGAVGTAAAEAETTWSPARP